MEEPPSKKQRVEPGPNATLAAGWTEHTAPSGHKYYYHKASKKSTYQRPVAAVDAPAQEPPAVTAATSHAAPAHTLQQPQQTAAAWSPPPTQPQHQPPIPVFSSQQGPAHPSPAPRHQPPDRPKRTEPIADCAPWLLVYTRLDRRFVHNPATRASFWRFPAAVMAKVVAHDLAKHGATPAPELTAEEEEREVERRRVRREAALREEEREDAELLRGGEEERVWVPPAPGDGDKGYDSSEYEEVEVTDDDDASSTDRDRDGDEPPAPLEFNEDDMAWQLAALGDAHGLDPDDYDDADDDAGTLPTPDEAHLLFAAMLADHAVSPFTPWAALIDPAAPHAVLDDPRFTALPSARARREAHAEWVRTAIGARRAKRAEDEAGGGGREEPAERFRAFLRGREKMVKKLYWVEFKRKFRREEGMEVTRAFGDREMERVYREFVAGLKKGGT